MKLPLTSFIFLLSAGAVIEGLHSSIGQESSDVFFFLYYLSLAVAIAWWMKTDAYGRKITLPFDLGLFLFMFWPIGITCYLIKTRGWKKFTAIAVLYLIAWAILYLVGYRIRSIV